jgi:hypothetical protein
LLRGSGYEAATASTCTGEVTNVSGRSVTYQVGG